MQGDFRVGGWLVQPHLGRICRNGESVRVRAKVMDLLVYLAARPGEVVSKETLLDGVWGTEAISESALTRTITELRQMLDDDVEHQRLIENIPKRGYRLIAPVDRSSSPITASGASPRAESESADGNRRGASGRRRFAVGTLLAGLIVLAIIAGLIIGSGGGSDSDRHPPRPFATAAGVESMPAWSPDGRMIAYAAEIDGYYQILIGAVDGKPAAYPLTRFDADCEFPAWDSTGTHVFFLVSRRALHGEIWGVSAAGGEPRRVVEDANSFAVEPNDGGITFVRLGTGGFELWHAESQGDTARKLGSIQLWNTAYSSFLAFSPDGRWLGISSLGDLLLVPYPFPAAPIEKSHRVNFGAQPGEVMFYFAWLPDSERVVFTARARAGDPQLWVGDIARQSARRLSASPEWEIMPAVSRDGSRLAYVTTSMDWDVFGIELSSATLRPLISTSRYESWPAWVPNGTEMVFSTLQSGRTELWKRDLRTGADEILVTPDVFGATEPSFFFAQPHVSPDGLRLAYVRQAPGSYRIFFQAIAGGPPVRLTDATPGEWREDSPSWSPDGHWVLFRRGSLILKAPAVGSASPIVLINDSSLGVGDAAPKWAGGGELVVYQSPTGLRRISCQGGPSALVSREQPRIWDVATDGRTILAVVEGPRRGMTLMRIDLTSSEVERIAGLGPIPVSPDPLGYYATLRGLRVSPDGTRLAFGYLKARSDIYIREGLLRSTR